MTKSLGGSDGKKKRAVAAHANPSFFMYSRTVHHEPRVQENDLTA